MRNLIVAAILVVVSGCQSSSDSGKMLTNTAPDAIPMCTTPDGGVCSGVPGAQGEKGDTGAQGPQGIQGPAGAAGSPGAEGAPGAQGPQGPQGPQGVQGVQGLQGPAGVSVPGPKGDQGAPGKDGKTASIQGRYNGTQATIGALVPLVNGGVGMFLYSQPGSAGTYPQNMIVQMSPSTIYYTSGACGGSAYMQAANNAFGGAYYNQLAWVKDSSTLWSIGATLSSVNYLSYDDGTGCHVTTSTIATGFPLTDSGYALNVPGTQPWTITVQ